MSRSSEAVDMQFRATVRLFLRLTHVSVRILAKASRLSYYALTGALYSTYAINDATAARIAFGMERLTVISGIHFRKRG